MESTSIEYDEKILEEISAWLSDGKHPDGTEPDCWTDASLKYCLALILQLRDENESLWLMLEEFKNSKWKPEHSEELHKSINRQLAMLKMMQLQKGEAWAWEELK
mgnify:CR=1 FL=1